MNRQQETDKHARIAMVIISGLIIFLFMIALSGGCYAQQDTISNDNLCLLDSVEIREFFYRDADFLSKQYSHSGIDTCLVKEEQYPNYTYDHRVYHYFIRYFEDK